MDKYRLSAASWCMVILAEVCCFCIGLVGPNIYSPSSSWCQTSTLNRDNTTTYTSWDIVSSLQGPPFRGTEAPQEHSNTILTASAPRVPVWTATFRASTLNILNMVPVVVFALMSIVGSVIRRCQRTTFPYSVFARASVVCAYALVITWIIITTCILGFAAEASWEWQQDLRGGRDLCTSLCASNSSSMLSCHAQVAGASETFWQGPNKPNAQYIGPYLLVGQLIVSITYLASFVSLAACIRISESIVVETITTNPALLVDTGVTLQPWSGGTPEICERIRHIPRELSPVAFVEALRNTRCREGLPDFIAGHARRVAASNTFTCPVCFEDCRICVDLNCSGEIHVAVGGVSASAVDTADGIAEGPISPADAALTMGSARHQFCPTCLALAIEIHPACPLCRREIALGN